MQGSGYSQNERMQGQHLHCERVARQSVQVLRPGLRTVYASGPDRAGGGGKSLPVCAECAGGDPIGLTACKNGSPKRSVRNMSFADWIKRKAKGGNNTHVYLGLRITEEG